MAKYCSMCGSPIPDDQGSRVCSMCYGDIDHGRDGYYREELRRQDEADERQRDAEHQREEEHEQE